MDITLTDIDGKIAVQSPYDAAYVRHARDLGGKWDASRRAWLFSAALRDDVLRALKVCYGYVPAEAGERRVTIQVTVHQSLSESQGPVAFGPYNLANARGRDSGARPGPNVALVSGSIGSSGSRKNWTSTVRKGAVFKIVDVAASVVDELHKIADRETFTRYDRVDDMDRDMVPTRIGESEHTWMQPRTDDGMPEGLVRRRGDGDKYHWARPVELKTFTVEEV